MANEAEVLSGTALSINGEAGADVALSAEGLVNGTGRVSAQIDLGVSPRDAIYTWACEVQFQATPTQFKTLDIYTAKAPDGDATQIDGDVGNADAALADIDMRSNLQYIGSVVSENATASEKCNASGVFTAYDRYLSIVIYNDSGATVDATDSNFQFKLTPKSWQGQ